jgi:hypothetical protein
VPIIVSQTNQHFQYMPFRRRLNLPSESNFFPVNVISAPGGTVAFHARWQCLDVRRVFLHQFLELVVARAGHDVVNQSLSMMFPRIPDEVRPFGRRRSRAVTP